MPVVDPPSPPLKLRLMRVIYNSITRWWLMGHVRQESRALDRGLVLWRYGVATQPCGWKWS